MRLKLPTKRGGVRVTHGSHKPEALGSNPGCATSNLPHLKEVVETVRCPREGLEKSGHYASVYAACVECIMVGH